MKLENCFTGVRGGWLYGLRTIFTRMWYRKVISNSKRWIIFVRPSNFILIRSRMILLGSGYEVREIVL